MYSGQGGLVPGRCMYFFPVVFVPYPQWGSLQCRNQMPSEDFRKFQPLQNESSRREFSSVKKIEQHTRSISKFQEIKPLLPRSLWNEVIEMKEVADQDNRLKSRVRDLLARGDWKRAHYYADQLCDPEKIDWYEKEVKSFEDSLNIAPYNP